MKSKSLRKALALAMANAMILGVVGSNCSLTSASGLPSTTGHDTYVNSDVFSVISSDSFGTTALDSPLFSKNIGSYDITNLQVPTLAYDDTSIGLVWEKPENYENVADYHVYINGELQETARENFKENAKWTYTYMQSFYDYYETASDVDMVDVDIHSFRATDLSPETSYEISVVAIDANGNELGNKVSITATTTKTPEVVNVLDYGVTYTEGYTEYNDEINAIIEANTKAIQAAIDAVPEGGKLVIPDNDQGLVLVSGALWLHSNMTLELDGTLWASPNSDHFEIGFLMYPFYTDTRDWGLINAVSQDENAALENIRITGSGTLYGNGWKYGAGDTMYGDGYTSNAGVNTQSGDPDVKDTQSEYSLPRYMGGSNTKVYYYGIQAADSAKKYLANLYNEDGTRKYSDELIESLTSKIKADKSDKLSSIETQDLKDAYATRASLLIMRNVTNVYVADITVENPSNHSVNILDSRNIATTNVKVFSYDGNNGDGLGYGCSQNVICWNNFTDTGDDNLGFGASVGEGARDCDIQTNSELWMFNNFLREGHGGLAAGSHTGNGIQDVLFEDTVMNHIDMAFRFKSAPTNGGFAANITMRDCAVADTNQAWVLTTSYSDPNSASSTEAAEIGEFYNFAAYNVSVYGANQNTICVYADVDYDSNPQKPAHCHHNLYFQDITFGNVGGNGSYKYYNGWDTLTGCENSVFYNVKTVSYNSKAVSKKTNAAWTNIKYCKNIIFQGTTLDSLNINSSNVENAMQAPEVIDNNITATSAEDGKSVSLSWATQKDNYSMTYGVDTYVNGKMVDFVSGLSDTQTTISSLSPGVDYTFKVYVSDKTGNKTLINEVSVKTKGEDTESIVAPTSPTVTLTNPIYTCAQASFASAYANDNRVRGYKIYANGTLVKTIYNYQIKDYKNAASISNQVGRLTAGINNEVSVVAFTDSGKEYKYDLAYVTTLGNYDYKAPVFAATAKITAVVNKDNTIDLSWDEAVDDTAVGGYRVYVDGVAVYTEESTDTFNPVNGAYTTNKTEITLTDVDTTKSHTITVQAGDTWWKAAKTMGNFDKMASYNWTVKGLKLTTQAYEEPITEDPTTEEPTTEEPATEEPTTPSETPSGEVAADTDIVYTMLTGSEVNYVNGEKLVLRSEADFDKFVGVRVDGRLIDKANYTAYSGSTIVEISENYMASLSNGKHEFEIVSNDGAAKAVVTVNKTETVTNNEATVSNTNSNTVEVAADSSEVTNSSKNTADLNNMLIYFLMILACGTISFVVARREYKNRMN